LTADRPKGKHLATKGPQKKKMVRNAREKGGTDCRGHNEEGETLGKRGEGIEVRNLKAPGRKTKRMEWVFWEGNNQETTRIMRGKYLQNGLETTAK